MPLGGAPFTNEDLSDVFQTEIWAALQAMLSVYDADAEGVIVSGCVVTPNAGNFDMTAGIVYLNGEFMRVDAVTNQTFTKYIKAATPTNVARVFQDTISKTFIVERKAEVSATVAAGGQEITIASVAASNNRRFSVATATKLGLTKLYANVAASNTDGAVTQAALVTALALKADVSQTAWANLSYTAPWTTQNYQAKYRKNNFGEVALKGEVWTHPTNVTGGIGGTLTIGTLPVGYRPVHDLLFPIDYYNGSARAFASITIASNGVIQYNGITGVVPSVNLDAIRFYTD